MSKADEGGVGQFGVCININISTPSVPSEPPPPTLFKPPLRMCVFLFDNLRMHVQRLL